MVKIKFLISASLVKYFKQQDSFELELNNYQDLLKILSEKFPAFANDFIDITNNKTKSFVNIYINEQDLRFCDLSSMNISSQDQVDIIPAISGGWKVCT